ncbi:MAG: SBBP repeat-containing protein [Bdellovibrionales bacterium]|nr:SBBP repeat-containing protein [Bdellovibrionales bacterium]
MARSLHPLLTFLGLWVKQLCGSGVVVVSHFARFGSLSLLLALLLTTSVLAEVPYGWSASFGSSEWDSASDIAVNRDGTVFVVGQFLGTVDFDPGPGRERLEAGPGDSDGVVSILSSKGKLLGVIHLRGEHFETYKAISFDPEGNIYLTGNVSSSPPFEPYALDLNPFEGEDLQIVQGWSDFFMTKLNADGSYAWSRLIGGPNLEEARDIAADSRGNVYVTGTFGGPADFDAGNGEDIFQASCLSLQCQGDFFLTKYDTNGNYQWTKTFGFNGVDVGHSLALDSEDNIVVGGTLDSRTAYIEGWGFIETFHNNDGFIARLDPQGNYLSFSVLGGWGNDSVKSIQTIGTDIVATGFFSDIADFDSGDSQLLVESRGGFDAFVARYTSQGVPVFVNQIGGSGDDFGTGVAIDPKGASYVTGEFSTTVDFDPTERLVRSRSAGSLDIFIAQYSARGKYIRHSTIGGGNTEECTAIAVGSDLSPVVSGFFYDPVDFDPTSSKDILKSHGFADGFVTKQNWE